MPALGLERRQQTEVGGSCLAAVVTGNRASGGAEPSDSENARQFRGHWLSHWSLLCLKPGKAPGVFRLVVRKKLPF